MENNTEKKVTGQKKVDKVIGKNLSSEDYTKEEKEKLGNISNITEQEIIAILGG